MLAIWKKSNASPSPLWVLIKSYYTGRHPKNNLYSRISPLGNPSLSVVPILDQWVQEGKNVRIFELRRIVRDLRSRRRYSHALEISEWMSSRGLCPFSPGDLAVQLDLIGRVQGWNAAESYFNKLNDQEKIDKTYGALLNCYVREGLVEKSLSQMQKMKEMGFSASTLNYNNIMCLYTHTGQLEEVPNVLSDMKKNGVSPDIYSYRICLNAYGAKSDLKSMENLLKEMESQPRISIDWNTYSVVANYYIKAGMKQKALLCMKKQEEKLGRSALGYNHLISLYASLGNKEEMRRLWGLQKAACKKQLNRDYITMLGSLVKLGELEEAKALLEEWELCCHNYDFRVPNVLLIGYCQRGLIEKAEAMLWEIIGRGKTPIPNSWAIIAAAYLEKEDMEKVFECMKNAMAVQAENPGWRPKPSTALSLLNWLQGKGDIEAEGFVSSLKAGVAADMDTQEGEEVVLL